MYDFQFFNGEIIPLSQPVMRTAELGILRGYGIFDYFYVIDNVIRFKEDCLARFRNAAQIMNLEIPLTDEALCKAIHDLLKANGKKEAGVRLVLTGGYTADGFTPTKPNFLIMQQALSVYPETDYTKGISLMTFDYKRDIPEVKTTNYSNAERIRHRFMEMGAADVLYYDNGAVKETSRANFYIVNKEGAIVTAGEGVLPGITRKQLLKLIDASDFTLELRPFSLEEMREAQEAFISSATKGVMPITIIDGQAIGDGTVGAVAKRLQALYLEHVADYMAKQK